MKSSPALGGIVAVVAVVIGGLVWAIDAKNDATQARDEVKQHSQLIGHIDTLVGIAEINRSIAALSESLGKLHESQTRTEARVYDLQLQMLFGGRGSRSELIDPVN
jgi:hypothetical protein